MRLGDFSGKRFLKLVIKGELEKNEIKKHHQLANNVLSQKI